MSEEKVSLDLLAARVLTLTAEVRDLQHRFTAMESRFTALESRVTALEVAMTTRLDAVEALQRPGRRVTPAQAAIASAARKNRRFGALRGRLASRSWASDRATSR
jgi:hypothetical protein